MRDPLMWCMAGILALYVALVMVRARVERNRAALEAAYIALED
jgi:hypothetical protein